MGVHFLPIFRKGLSNENGEILLGYNFAQPAMTLQYNQRLVFDAAGMIGSVGGTLGMCIGFSFSGMTSFLLNSIKSRLSNYLDQV